MTQLGRNYDQTYFRNSLADTRLPSIHKFAQIHFFSTQRLGAWQLTRYSGVKDEPIAWSYMSRVDSAAETVDFVRRNGGCKPEKETVSPTPVSRAPIRPTAPMKLQ